MGTLYYGDKLTLLRCCGAGESAGLVFPDPPTKAAQKSDVRSEGSSRGLEARTGQIVTQAGGGKSRGPVHGRRVMGCLVSPEWATGPVKARAAGFECREHKLNGQWYPRLQLRTGKALMDGRGLERPSSSTAVDEVFKKAPAARKRPGQQTELSI